MLTLNREAGQTIYIGKALAMSDLPGTCEYQIDIDAVDNRIASRHMMVTISGPDRVVQLRACPKWPDIDFAEGMRVSLLQTHEYLGEGGASIPVARVGINAPREMHILRDDVNPISAMNKGVGR